MVKNTVVDAHQDHLTDSKPAEHKPVVRIAKMEIARSAMIVGMRAVPPTTPGQGIKGHPRIIRRISHGTKVDEALVNMLHRRMVNVVLKLAVTTALRARPRIIHRILHRTKVDAVIAPIADVNQAITGDILLRHRVVSKVAKLAPIGPQNSRATKLHPNIA